MTGRDAEMDKRFGIVNFKGSTVLWLRRLSHIFVLPLTDWEESIFASRTLK